MFLYFGKTFHSATAGALTVGVQCEQCQCEYFYQLTRIGTGAGSAAYNLGQTSASARAENESRHDLERRLAEEAELVPCPRCQWINDELVRGYRLGRYRHWSKAALFGSIIAIATCLFCAWFLYLTAPAERRVL